MKRKWGKGIITLAAVVLLAGGMSVVAYARPLHHSGASRYVRLQSLDRYRNGGCHGMTGLSGHCRIDGYCEPAVDCRDDGYCEPAADCRDEGYCEPAADCRDDEVCEAACYRNGVCSEYGSCDVDGVCRNGGICQGPWCEQDGSCDVNGICRNGTDCNGGCDGSIHASQTHHGNGRGHHGGSRSDHHR